MTARELTLQLKNRTVKCYIQLSAYTTPFADPPLLLVKLLPVDQDPQLGPGGREVSVNLPHMPHPPAASFYMKTWGEHDGLLEQMEAHGVVRVVDRAGVPISPAGPKAVLCELTMTRDEMEVCIPCAEERRRLAGDSERFLSNTYVMHLGM